MNIAMIEQALQSCGYPVFLARVIPGQTHATIDVHTTSGTRSRITKAIRQNLDRLGAGADVHVKVHSHADLFEPRSLESLERRFGGGQIVFDPTGAYARISEVLDCGKALRMALGEKLQSVYFEPWRRAFYLVLSQQGFAKSGVERERQVETAVSQCHEALAARAAIQMNQMDMTVRIGFEAPAQLRLVAVDAATARETVYRRWNGTLMAKLGGLLAALGIATAAGVAMASTPTVQSGTPATDVQLPAESWYQMSADLFDMAGNQHVVVPASTNPLAVTVGRALDIRFFQTDDIVSDRSAVQGPAAEALLALAFLDDASAFESRSAMIDIYLGRGFSSALNVQTGSEAGDAFEIAQALQFGYGTEAGTGL